MLNPANVNARAEKSASERLIPIFLAYKRVPIPIVKKIKTYEMLIAQKKGRNLNKIRLGKANKPNCPSANIGYPFAISGVHRGNSFFSNDAESKYLIG